MDFLRRLLGLQPVETEQTDETPVQQVQPVMDVVDEVLASADEMSSIAGASEEEEMPDDGRTRQLPPLEEVLSDPVPGARLIYGQLSDVGQVRDNNQDAVLSFMTSMTSADHEPNFGLFVVADGMGGHEHGEKASAVTTQIITKHVTGDIFIPMLNGETGGDSGRPTIIEVLRHAVQQANEVVSDSIPDGGTTVTAAAVLDRSAYIAHVGDSRAYIISQDNIEQVTRDHSLVQRLIELDQLTPEDAIEHPQRNVLYRAIGQSDNLEVDAIKRLIPPGGYLLLCSDGLWNLVSQEEIHQMVLKQADNPQNACTEMVALANERGGSDNITVVLIRVPG